MKNHEKSSNIFFKNISELQALVLFDWKAVFRNEKHLKAGLFAHLHSL